MKQRLFALFVALSLCLASVGCSRSTPATAGQVGNTSVSSGLYLLAQYNAYQQAVGLAESDADTDNVKKFLNSTVTPEDDTTQKVSDYVAAQTEAELRRYAAVEELFAQNNGELTTEQLEQADTYAQQILDGAPEVYAKNGIGLETLKLYERNLAKSDALLELLYGTTGKDPIPESELNRYLETDAVYGCYFIVPLYSLTTYQFADETQVQQVLSLAQQTVTQYQALWDSYRQEKDDNTTMLSCFYTALEETAAPMYQAVGSEYDTANLKDDLISGLLTDSALTNYFREDAIQTLKGLSVGQAVGLQYTDYGVMVFVRMDAHTIYTTDDLRSMLLYDMRSQTLNDTVQAAGAALSYAMDGSAVSSMSPRNIVTK